MLLPVPPVVIRSGSVTIMVWLFGSRQLAGMDDWGWTENEKHGGRWTATLGRVCTIPSV
ncbi:hypothetical protein IMZ48_13840 [Candidatus Bathyarchaeota archaeon]|nr:hypothetical protein [Candidatus Bathyarchaeota archaeon]